MAETAVNTYGPSGPVDYHFIEEKAKPIEAVSFITAIEGAAVAPDGRVVPLHSVTELGGGRYITDDDGRNALVAAAAALH